jgi:hypothetical protein
LPKPFVFELGSGRDRSHPDSPTEADAASVHGLTASPEQRTFNETAFASRRYERNEAGQQNQTSFTF